MNKLPLVLVLDNVRSAHNVGAILRSADGAGITKVILTGITPHPRVADDPRPPYVIEKAERAIEKTALGALVPIEYIPTTEAAIRSLREAGMSIYALEQSPQAKPLYSEELKYPAALIVGPEVEGINSNILSQVDEVLEIPMHGSKNSLNVAVAASVAMFELRRSSKN